MFYTILGILGVIVGITMVVKGIMIIFRKDPMPEGCLCKRTRLTLDINYDCPFHGDWR